MSVENGGDFLQGMRDCERGIPHQPGKSQDYDNGYATQYALEQINSQIGLNYDKRNSCGTQRAV